MARKNSLKEKLQAGKKVIGAWCEIASPTVANVMGNAGLDFIIIDMEHGPMSYETAEFMARSAETEGCWPIVRVTDDREPTMLRALELGNQAIMVPHVESAAKARKVVEACRYHPEGNRGMGPYTRNHNYSHDNLTHTLGETNRETFVGILVEGKEGLGELDQIAAVPGLDLVYLGVYDISQAVGYPGQLRHPVVIEAIKKAAQTLRSHNVAAGSYAMDVEYARFLMDCGFQFIAFFNDVGALSQYFREIGKTLRT